ncbi:succinyl-CoA synthetase-like protein [Aspergillus ruber CBS 135680]|uniref:Succinyl-CoA synthetase-like protein n=1 Tax=Aspergillus ruber (strain CBS 135680) TaxID=1388766 RepID=A0A017SR32_ASPRC|nr:succinyl-CoA synthetase-like protein [Aspergillus ruber CBS 135680]EYE99019.1 succinyl-CoA synthetase-like protein [Aspergillus ruber CBS 135680]
MAQANTPTPMENAAKPVQPEVPTNRLRTLLQELYSFFTRTDATHLEITKLLHAPQDTFLYHDTSALAIDHATAPRQSDLANLRDNTTKSPAQREAEKQDLVYVRLNDGDVGTVVNGGQATTETMVKAFEIVLEDERVRVVLVNIYGGIVRCNMVAESIIQAAARLGPLRCPMVVRLQGTNSEEGQRLIQESGLNLIAESDFE